MTPQKVSLLAITTFLSAACAEPEPEDAESVEQVSSALACSAIDVNKLPTFRSTLDLNALPSGCTQVPLGSTPAIRCSSSSIFSNPNASGACGAPLQSKVLFSNGEPKTVALINNGFQLAQGMTLQSQITQWWGQYNNPATTANVRASLSVLLASAYDQICNDSPVHDRTTCQVPFPDLQNARYMSSGWGCPMSTTASPLDSSDLFSNGTVAGQTMVVTHLPLATSLRNQVASWESQYASTTHTAIKQALATLLAMAYDQVCRCGGSCTLKPYTAPYSRQPGGAFASWDDFETGPPRNALSALQTGWISGQNPGASSIQYAIPPRTSSFEPRWFVGPGLGATANSKLLTGATPQSPFVRTTWTTAPWIPEVPGTTRFTWLEYRSVFNMASFSDEVVTLSFDIRLANVPTGVVQPMIPILWQAFGNGSPVLAVIVDGPTVNASSTWQHVVHKYRLPSIRNRSVTNASYVGVGIDMATLGFKGSVDLANMSLSR